MRSSNIFSKTADLSVKSPLYEIFFFCDVKYCQLRVLQLKLMDYHIIYNKKQK